MKQEQQRIAIAEACGITVRADLSGYCNDHQGCADWNVIPDYLNDLNAMHEAEKVLDAGQRRIFGDFLAIAVGHTEPSMARGYDLWLGASAAAAQRAEAFLRTLNLWKPEEEKKHSQPQPTTTNENIRPTNPV